MKPDENPPIAVTYEAVDSAIYSLNLAPVSLYSGTYDIAEYTAETEKKILNNLNITDKYSDRIVQELTAETLRLLLRLNRNLISVKKLDQLA